MGTNTHDLCHCTVISSLVPPPFRCMHPGPTSRASTHPARTRCASAMQDLPGLVRSRSASANGLQKAQQPALFNAHSGRTNRFSLGRKQREKDTGGCQVSERLRDVSATGSWCMSASLPALKSGCCSMGVECLRHCARTRLIRTGLGPSLQLDPKSGVRCQSPQIAYRSALRPLPLGPI
jgi:hypothetical protein